MPSRTLLLELGDTLPHVVDDTVLLLYVSNQNEDLTVHVAKNVLDDHASLIEPVNARIRFVETRVEPLNAIANLAQDRGRDFGISHGVPPRLPPTYEQTQRHRKRANRHAPSESSGRTSANASGYGTTVDEVQSDSNCCLIGANVVGSNTSAPTSRFLTSDV